jgi:hypothetical protein
MLSGIKPLTITKRQAKELLPPKLVDRLIYAAKNFPEIGWLEILPKEEGKEVRETYIVYESLERAFQRIRAGEYPPDFPSDVKDRKKRRALKLVLDSRIEIGQSPGGLKKVSRDFDVIQPVSGPLPDGFLSTLQNFLYSALPV